MNRRCHFPDAKARMPGMTSLSPADDAWRDILLNASIEGRLGDLDRRTLEHRFDAANRPARRDAVRGEIEVVTRFLALGASVVTETSEPEGPPVDLRVTLDDLTFAVHVKRLGPAPAPGRPVPAAFESLTELPRPYVAGVEWHGGDPASSAASEAREFLLGARLGDRCLLRDVHDRHAGTIELLAPTGDIDGHIRLKAMGDPLAAAAFVDRAGRHLRRAYRQFAPGLENVIVLAGGGAVAGDLVDLALLGGHVERWDRLPRIGQRVAHGRDDRGLWTGRRYERSRIVAWCPLVVRQGRVWTREDFKPPTDVLEAMRRAIGAPLARSGEQEIRRSGDQESR
jgi:hypothetical protein